MSELVSIIIPVYNAAPFLKDSLESVINQTYSNIEIICIDDGSEDNSLEILKFFSDKITIISQENQGLASALNVGIKKMKGKWFKWFSPDDVMFHNTIEILVNEAEKFSNTIIYSDWDIIDEKSNL
ncbi:glycosyltransferase, partial [Nitrosopumilus sp.]|nr:glycosyltransferase [Nitrosopumilus sp.]